MQTTFDSNKSYNLIKNKENSFYEKIESHSFFLLIKPSKTLFSNIEYRNLIGKQIKQLTKTGFKNLEISWSNHSKWVEFVSNIKLKFPQLNLGSASIINKKSIDDSMEVGLAYSMMKFWDKNLLNYAKAKKHLLIPGIKNIKDLQEAIDLNCKIIKIYPAKQKDELINLSQYKNIYFIAAGGLSISDLQLYKSLGYKAIIIGDKGFVDNDIDPKIYKWLSKI